MYVCVYVYMYVCICMYICMYVCVCMYVCMYVCTYVGMLCMYVYMYTVVWEKLTIGYFCVKIVRGKIFLFLGVSDENLLTIKYF